ncbi:UDP-glycosyltransferase 88B1-like protein [Drosera capensis]
MANNTVVLYPFSAIGHLISTVELGKLILTHHPSLSLTILVSTAPPPFSSTAATTAYLNQVSLTTPSITFHHLPATTTLPPDSTNISFEALAFRLLQHNNDNLRHALETIISRGSSIKAFIIDFFCDPAFEVSTSLGIATYYFFTTSAFGLAVLLYAPVLHETIPINLKDLDHRVRVPGIMSFPPLDSPSPLLDRTAEAYHHFLRTSLNMRRSHGIIVNTFEMFESRAIKAISNGLCTPNGRTPPVYSIGPLIGPTSSPPCPNECLDWLNSQPRRSVVFLCFGSMGRFSKAQLAEIAIGLERSGSRFLWVVRSPPEESDSSTGFNGPDLDQVLPIGFLHRTKSMGLVVKSWAPQKEVLAHESVGGFVTHCGWNSVLESVALGGVPVIGWPLYAEQRFNRVVLVEEIKVALDLEMSSDGFVAASEVEKRVRELMEPESVAGKAVRVRVAALRDGAVAAMANGGSSLVALDRLAKFWI